MLHWVVILVDTEKKKKKEAGNKTLVEEGSVDRQNFFYISSVMF